MFAPEKTAILQMDENSTLLSRTEFNPDAMPDAFTPVSAAYLIAETHKQDATIKREVFSKDDEVLQTFFAQPDGLCIWVDTPIAWSAEGGGAM